MSVNSLNVLEFIKLVSKFSLGDVEAMCVLFSFHSD